MYEYKNLGKIWLHGQVMKSLDREAIFSQDYHLVLKISK